MSKFSKIASEVSMNLSKTAAAKDKDAEWQRVNALIADILKDSFVIYAKLARLQGDFKGEELDNVQKISDAIRQIGEEFSGFSKAFSSGRYESSGNSGFDYGQQPSNTEQPHVPNKPEGESDSYDVPDMLGTLPENKDKEESKEPKKETSEENDYDTQVESEESEEEQEEQKEQEQK